MPRFISGEIDKPIRERFKLFIKKLGAKKVAAAFATLLLLIALPITVFVSLQKQIFYPHASGNTITISGTVYDAITHQPIQGAIAWDGISSSTKQTDDKNITDENGRFYLQVNEEDQLIKEGSNLTNGKLFTNNMYVVISKPGYQGQEVKQTLTGHDITLTEGITLAPAAPINKLGFIKTKGTQMWDQSTNKPFYFVGAQILDYGNIEEWTQRHRAGWGQSGGSHNYAQDVSVQEELMQTTIQTGISVVRVGVSGPALHAPQADNNGFPIMGNWPLMIGHEFQQRGLLGLDRLIALAGKNHQRLIITLMSSGNVTGDGEFPKIACGDAGCDWTTDPRAIKFYQDYASGVLNHINILTGVALKDDPAILAWDICNEAYFGENTYQWYDQQAAFLKGILKNNVSGHSPQLVTTGKDGDYGTLLHSSNIDFATWHSYPSDINNKTGTDGVINSGWGIYYDYPYYKGNNDVHDGKRIDHKPNEQIDGPVTQSFFSFVEQQAINDAQVANKPLVLEEIGVQRYMEDPRSEIIEQSFDNTKITLDPLFGKYGSPERRKSWIKAIYDASHQKPTMKSGGNVLDRPGFLEWGKWKKSDQDPRYAGAPEATPQFTSSSFVIDTTTSFTGSTSAKIISPSEQTSQSCLFQDIKVPASHTRYWWSAVGKTDMGKDVQAQLYGWDGSKWTILDSNNGISSQRLFTENTWKEKGGFIDSGTYQYLRAVLTVNGQRGGNAWFDRVQLIPYVSTGGQDLPTSIAGVVWWSVYYESLPADPYAIDKDMPKDKDFKYFDVFKEAARWAGSFNPPTSTPTPTVPPVVTPTPTKNVTPTPPPTNSSNKPRVNALFSNNPMSSSQNGIFWYGKINENANYQENYTDVRIGYNNSDLYINLSIADHHVMLGGGDKITLVLNKDGIRGTAPSNNSYLFNITYRDHEVINGSLKEWYSDDLVYKGDGTKWIVASLPFATQTNWQGDGPHEEGAHGWMATIKIPFSSLGLSGMPSTGTTWALASVTHDQDGSVTAPTTVWPTNMHLSNPQTWGILHFGIPIFTPPATKNDQTIKIQRDHYENPTVAVEDVDVGGHKNCGTTTDHQVGGDNRWSDWGNTNWLMEDSEGEKRMASLVYVQNETNVVSDWVCFGKTYIKFPLNKIPKGKIIKSAKLILGLAGPQPGADVPNSRIQLLTTNPNWSASTITWNNAPQANENVAILPVTGNTAQGHESPAPQAWDISYAINNVYMKGDSNLSLALYSADFVPEGKSTSTWKHFDSSFIAEGTENWTDPRYRPYLTVTYGDYTSGTSNARKPL